MTLHDCSLLAVTTLFLLNRFCIYFLGAINCYCNQPECQATHTCFSHLEKCYSKFYTVYPQQNNDTKTESKDEHGCVDLVNPGSRDSTMCEGRGDVVKALTAHESLIMCCSDNMCNYRKNLDRPIVQVDIMDTLEVKTGKDLISEWQIIDFLLTNGNLQPHLKDNILHFCSYCSNVTWHTLLHTMRIYS